jgi:uncharacterized protein (TIGR02145 family)
MKNQILAAVFCSTILAVSCKKETTEPAPEIKDADGNVYTEVKIGNQTWLAENLKATKFRNGDPIPNVTSFSSWSDVDFAAYCNYNNDAAIGNAEGRLYNWFVVNDPRNICPPGYHIPNRDEIETLRNFLGGESVAGGKLKMTGETFWTGNTGANNTSGFNGIGAGLRNVDPIADQDFIHRKLLGLIWTTSSVTAPGFEHNAFYLHLQANIANANISTSHKLNGLSIRCIKD